MPGSDCRAIPPPPDDQAGTRRLVIHGTTWDGSRFRPSDWAMRLATAAACNRDDRVLFHPLVRAVIIDGTPAVVVDGSLARSDAPLYDFLKRFARDNRLQVSEY